MPDSEMKSSSEQNRYRHLWRVRQSNDLGCHRAYPARWAEYDASGHPREPTRHHEVATPNRTRWPHLQVLSTQTAPGDFPPAFGAATLNRLRRLNVFTPRNLPCRRTPRAGQPMTATDGLNRALLSLAAAGDRPRCSDPITRELWTAELAAHRAIAVKWCKRCPVLVLCRQAAEERDERFGVWGGVDRSIRPGRKVA